MNRHERRRVARRGRRVDGTWRDAVAAVIADIDRVRDHDRVVVGLVVAILSTPPAGGGAVWWVSHGVHDRLAASPAMLLGDAAAVIQREAAALRAARAERDDA